MSGITSVVQPVFSGIGDAVSSVASGIGDALTSGGGALGKNILSDAELSQQQSEKEQQAQANAAAKENELTDAANQQTLLRNQALQKGLSHAKAFFAAQGIDPNSGTPYALANADTANTNELNDYTDTQLNNSIADLNRGVSNLESNDLLTRTQKTQDQLLNSFL